MIYILLSEQSGGRKVKHIQNMIEKSRHFGKMGSIFKFAAILNESEFENVKFGFLDLKNPRKVLLHKIIGSGKRNLPKYSQYDI